MNKPNIFCALMLACHSAWPGLFNYGIEKGENDHHQQGQVIGTIKNIKPKGLLITGFNVGFQPGGGIIANKAALPEAIKMSALNASVVFDLGWADHGAPVILHYRKRISSTQFLDRVWYGNSTVVTDIEPLTSLDQQGLSIGSYWKDSEHHGKGRHAQTAFRGKILRVFRWGVFDKLCTAEVYLNEDHLRHTVHIPNALIALIHQLSLGYIGTTGHQLLPDSSPSRKDTITGSDKMHRYKTTKMNIFSEEGCHFAEQAMKSAALVGIESSTRFFKLADGFYDSISTIKILKEGVTPDYLREINLLLRDKLPAKP